MEQPMNATFKPGKVLADKWIIIELIGRGAMGEVYRAHQMNLKRDVAIKIISQDVMSEIADDPEELDIAFGRFQREVQTMAQVRHTNILTIYDYGEIKSGDGSGENRVAFIVMEFIPGNSLRFTLPEDGFDDVPELYAEWIRDYFVPVLDGVETLHNNKIVHRDLKPENIFLDGDIPKIADFGLARSQQMKAVTCSIEMLGTLAYMSPEQCADFKYAGYATDIYALGKILFEAVNGTLSKKAVPFTSVHIDNPQTHFLQKMSAIINKATAEKSGNRYQTIREFRNDLQQALDDFNGGGDGKPIKSATENHLHKMVTNKQIKFLGAGVVILIAFVMAVHLYDLFFKVDPTVSSPDEKIYIDKSDALVEHHAVTVENNTTPAETFLGRDGSRMVLTGDLTNSTGKKSLFYMDNRKITNFLFIEFLHKIEDRITVKNGIVRHEGKIVFYIGNGSAGEDKIIFDHDTFHLKNQDDGSKPVLRVTYHGAQMYAKQYGRELLTDKEWRSGYQYHLKDATQKEIAASTSRPQENFTMMMHYSPAAGGEKERVSVLDNMGETVKEWVRVTKSVNSQTVSPGDDMPVSGVMDASRVKNGAEALLRFPWEGFEDVGFRTKIPIIRK